MNEICVKVMKRTGRKYFTMYFVDPITGAKETRSTGEATAKAAERAAAVWESELRAGKYKPASNVSWDDFRERYESEVLPSFAPKTFNQVSTAFNSVERLVGKPKLLRSITAEWLSKYQSALRASGVSEATVASYLSHIKAALKWAVELEWLPEVPKVKMPKKARRQKVMKGRPITGEEFDRLLAKVEAGLLSVKSQPSREAKQNRKWGDGPKSKRLAAREKKAAAVAESWRYLLRGLWLSGLRLGEALELWWDDRPDKISVDLSGRRPMLRIRAELEKGGQDRILPITPDFAAFLMETPEGKRRGPVFRPLGMTGEECRLVDYVGKQIANIGKAAGIKVDVKRKKDRKGAETEVVKYASAHDLRRSFGARWAPKVMPAVLQQLMRHESVETTMRFYVGQNADATADAIWDAWGQSGATLGATSPNPPASSAKEKPQTLTD